MTKKRYYFDDITHCEMCQQKTNAHKIIGQRLNQSQGLNPKNKLGISVTIQKCTNCGLVYCSPQPVPFDIQDHYGIAPEDYSWGDDYITYDPSYYSIQIEDAKRLLPFVPNMKALDVGAGLGKAMKSMENSGFEVYGIEPSKTFYKKALEWMGLSEDRLKLGMVEDIDYPENSFDFITFGAVYEHVYHPADVLSKAAKWLKPNGIIHIEVPSADWLIPKVVNFFYKLRGTNFVTHLSPMHAPFHLYEFTVKSFEEICKRFNLELAHHYTDVCEIYYVPNILRPLVGKYMKRTNSGMQLTVYLRKKA